MSDSGNGHVDPGGGGDGRADNVSFFDIIETTQSQHQSENQNVLTQSVMNQYLENVNSENESMEMTDSENKEIEQFINAMSDEGFRHVYVNIAANEERNKSLGHIDPIDLQENMKGKIGNYKSCKPLKSGSLLVEVNEFQQIKTLLLMKQFMNIKVETKIASEIGSTKGTIYEPRIINRSVEQLCRIWKDYGVINVEKHSRKEGTETRFTGKFTLTFKDTMPSKILVGDQSKQVIPWVRSVLQCRKCNKFNHFAKYCTNNDTCDKCSTQHADGQDCQTAIVKCSNCRQIGHGARDKNCSHYLREKKICEIRNESSVGYKRAKEILEDMEKSPQVSQSYFEISSNGAVHRKSGPIPGVKNNIKESIQGHNPKRNSSVRDSWNEPNMRNPFSERKDRTFNRNDSGKQIPDTSSRFKLPTFNFGASTSRDHDYFDNFKLDTNSNTLVMPSQLQDRNTMTTERNSLEGSIPYNDAVTGKRRETIPNSFVPNRNINVLDRNFIVEDNRRETNSMQLKANDNNWKFIENQISMQSSKKQTNRILAANSNRFQVLRDDEDDDDEEEQPEVEPIKSKYNLNKRRKMIATYKVDTNKKVRTRSTGMEQNESIDNYTDPIKFKKADASTQTEEFKEIIIVPTKYKTETSGEASTMVVDEKLETITVSIVKELCSNLNEAGNQENISLICDLIKVMANKKLDIEKIETMARSYL